MTLKNLHIFMSKSGEKYKYVHIYVLFCVHFESLRGNEYVCENNLGGLIFCHIFPLNNLCRK